MPGALRTRTLEGAAGGRQEVLPFDATFYSDAAVFRKQRPNPLRNESLTPAGCGREADVITSYCFGTRLHQKV